MKGVPITLRAIRAGTVKVISDTHYGHNNIVRYTERPGFDAGGERHDFGRHNRLMDERWRAAVSSDDLVLHVGDVAMNAEAVDRYCALLPGDVVYVPGNHDKKRVKDALAEIGWRNVGPFTIAWRNPEGREILVRVSHRPIMSLQAGEGNAHGHVHNGPRLQGYLDKFTAAHFNLSVEEIGYGPIDLGPVLAQIEAGINHSARQGHQHDDGLSAQLRAECAKRVVDLGDGVTFIS